MGKLKQLATFAGIVVVATAATLAVFIGLPFFGSFERWVENYRIATLTPPEPQHPDIVILAVNDDTLTLFPYNSPIDRGFLADLLELVVQRGGKGVLLDVLLDRPTEPDKDARLKAVLDAYPIPLVASYGREPERLNAEQIEFLESFVPRRQWAFGNLVKDDIYDGTVRGIYQGRALPDGTFLPGLATALAQQLLGRELEHEPRELAYRGLPKEASVPPFAEIPSHNARVLPAAMLAGKIVLIGGDFSLIDRHRSPWAAVTADGSGIIPGIMFHAHALAQLLDERESPTLTATNVALLVLAAAVVGMILGAIDVAVSIRVGAAAAIVVAFWVLGFVLFRYGDLVLPDGGPLLPVVTPSISLALALWMTGTYIARQDLEQKRFIQQAFSRYLSPALLARLMDDPTRLAVGAERHALSFIFTDIAGFTTVSEQMDAAELASVLNRYLDGMCEIVFKHDGLVDKFIGDAVFAIFNAFEDQPDHARRAVACALELDAYATAFHDAEVKRGKKFGITRIGVHTGAASIGNFGSLKRHEFTALGDAVNTAARLEGLNKYFGTRVSVSAAAAEQCPDIPFRPLGDVVLKGKTEAITVLEPLSRTRAESESMRRYRDAYDRLAARDPDSRARFAALHDADPTDGCIARHLARLAAGETGTRIVMDEK